jgi:hypothetical protein
MQSRLLWCVLISTAGLAHSACRSQPSGGDPQEQARALPKRLIVMVKQADLDCALSALREAGYPVNQLARS